jgi:hypothetical protein
MGRASDAVFCTKCISFKISGIESSRLKLRIHDPFAIVHINRAVEDCSGEHVEQVGAGDAIFVRHRRRFRHRLNRRGPISVAQNTTPKRTFATVTPCFVASAAYGSPLAGAVSGLVSGGGLEERAER